MAVQKSKKSKSRKGMRRSHDHVVVPNVTFCPACSEPTLNHRACANCGVYKENQVISKADA